MSDDHDTAHDGAGSHAHHEDDATAVTFAVLTVSSSRTLDDDESGDAIVEALESDGHTVASRDLLGDDERAIGEYIEEVSERDDVDAIVTTGGTGLTPDDVTPGAVTELFDRDIPGFGEQFRTQSVEEVGPHGMLTRATAGIVGESPVFCLPGSEQAATFGTTELVLPVVGHVVSLAGGGGHGEHDHGDEDHSHPDEGHDHGHGGHE